jgi:hypothetical protein
MNKIGYIEYFATGEGQTIAIFLNHTVEEIKEEMGEYFCMGLRMFDAEDIINAKESEGVIESKGTYFVKIIMEKHTPMLYKKLEDGFPVKASYHYHINLS